MEHIFQVESDTCVQNNSHFYPQKLLHVGACVIVMLLETIHFLYKIAN